MDKQDLAAYLLTVVKPLVTTTMESHPRVDIKSDEMGILLTLTVPDGDFGKVIGKGGGNIKAIRHILTAIGMMYKMRVSVKVNDPVKDQVYA